LSLERKEFALMKLRGLFARPQTLKIWPPVAMESHAFNAELGCFLGKVLTTRTVICVGANLDDIGTWLSSAQLPEKPSRKHYALMPRTAENTGPKAKALLRKYNIHIVPYSPEKPADLFEFLTKLDSTVLDRTVKA
jgi:hypothetical protein